MRVETAAYRATLARTAGALPKSGSRASDARARAAWEKALDALADAGEREARRALITLGSHGESAPPRDPSAIAEEVAIAVAKALRKPLYRHARSLGIARVGRARVNRAWVKASRESARAWVRAQASDAAWGAAYHTLIERLRETATRALRAERLGAIAQAGPEARARIARATPWLAGEAAQWMEPRALHAPCAHWARAYVNRWRARLDLAPLASARRCAWTLGRWRWPDDTPPGSMVALCAQGERLESESDWANAAREARHWRAWRKRARKVGEARARGEMRARAGDEPERVREAIARWARAWAHERYGGSGAACEARIETMKARWGACEALEGDGTIARPTLASDINGTLQWTLAITGPETLGALSHWLGSWPEHEVGEWENVIVGIDHDMGFGEERGWKEWESAVIGGDHDMGSGGERGRTGGGATGDEERTHRERCKLAALDVFK